MSEWNEVAQEIVEAAFAAAIDDDLWTGVTDRILDATGGTGCFLGIADRRTGDIAHFSLNRATAQAVEEYRAGMSHLDPQLPVVAGISQTGIYLDSDHLDWSNPSSAEFMRWVVDRLGWRGHVTVASRLAEHHVSGFSFHFTKDNMDARQRARELLTPIADALAQALQLGFLHGDKLTQEYWRGLSAQIDDHSAFLISDTGKIMRMNSAAEALTSAGNVLTERQGRLYCMLPKDQERLNRLIASAITAIGPQPGVALFRTFGRQIWLARISPVVRNVRMLVIDEPAALLTVRSLDRASKSNAHLWRELFGLTATEAKVADHLRQGLAANSIATILNMSVGTVRTHTKMIHDKTETRRNAELAYLLTLLAEQS